MTSIQFLKLVAFWLSAAASGAAGSAGAVAPAHAHSSESVAARPASTAAPAPAIALIVSNPTVSARAHETVAVAISEVLRKAPGFDVKKVEVMDASGAEVLSQLVDMDGDETADEIVFQTDFGPKESKTFQLKVGQRHPFARDDYRVYGRFVRERHDDFAWENDRVAHRMYGPELETFAKESLISSGIDTWVKRVPKLVVNDWYMTDNYHQDVGEGADLYGVGKSRGLGGIGVWAGSKLHVSKNFTQSRVLASGPIRLVFELTYAPWDAGGTQVAETKRVIIDAGSQFNCLESTFTGHKGKLVAGIGLAKHPGSTVKTDARNGAMWAWEPLDGGKAGNLGTAVVLPSGSHLDEHHNELDYLVVTNVPASGRLVYYAGSAWDRAGRIRDAADWAAEVQSLASRLAAPVKISLRIDQ